jgi:hypothetical protein
MRRYARRFGAALVMVGGVYASSGWLTAAGYDVWRVGEYQQQLEAHERYSQELDATMEGSEYRRMMKEELVKDYLAGRVTFAAITDEFEHLNASCESIHQALHDMYPGLGDRELAGRNVLDFVAAGVPKDAPDRAAVFAKVGAEFRKNFPQLESPKLW